MLKFGPSVQVEAGTLDSTWIKPILPGDHILEVVLQEKLDAHTVEIAVVPNIYELEGWLCVKSSFLLFQPSFHEFKI